MLLRDIVDLDATYGHNTFDATAAAARSGGGSGRRPKAKARRSRRRVRGRIPKPRPASRDAGRALADGEEDAEEAAISLAAMELELKPGVLEKLEAIAAHYRNLYKQQEQRLVSLKDGEELQKPSEKRYDKLKAEMVELMQNVRLNNARIDQLVGQLYVLNRRLVAAEGRLLRYAEQCGVKRQDFLNHHVGFELAPDWVQRVKRLHGKGWSGLIGRYGNEVKNLALRD